jgi:hypothetical protein
VCTDSEIGAVTIKSYRGRWSDIVLTFVNAIIATVIRLLLDQDLLARAYARARACAS